MAENYLDEVPKLIREPLEGISIDTLMSILGVHLAVQGVGLTESVHYLEGARLHQERLSITEGDMASGVFPATIVRTETFERKAKSSGAVIGKKARIVFTGNSGDEETIDTEWIEYNGYDKDSQVFLVALSNTILDLAESLEGKKVFIRKVFASAETKFAKSGKVRFIGDLWPDSRESDSSGHEDSKSRKSGGKSRSKKEESDEDEVTIDSILDHIDENATRLAKSVGEGDTESIAADLGRMSRDSDFVPSDLSDVENKFLNDIDDAIQDGNWAKAFRIFVNETGD